MALITLICPHCGGEFELDPERGLQPYWVCPYCGNRSLMQKSDNAVRLRGIISGKTSLTSFTPKEQRGAPTGKDGAGERPSEEQATAAGEQGTVTEAEPLVAETVEVAGKPSSAAAIGEPAPHKNTYRSLAEIIAEAVAEPTSAPEATPSASSGESATIDGSSPRVNPDESANAARPNLFRPSDQPKSAANNGSELDDLCKLAEAAAKRRDLPLFNSYSRRAIDLQPSDPRMYAWRAILIEEAGGFARATWTAPYWMQQAPSRKTALIAQHFYNLSTSLRFCQESRRAELLRRIAGLIVKQAVDHFHEHAVLRCRQHLIFKTFKGNYRGEDLAAAMRFTDAMRHLEPDAFPVGQAEFLDAIRNEIELLPPRVARRMLF